MNNEEIVRQLRLVADFLEDDTQTEATVDMRLKTPVQERAQFAFAQQHNVTTMHLESS